MARTVAAAGWWVKNDISATVVPGCTLPTGCPSINTSAVPDSTRYSCRGLSPSATTIVPAGKRRVSRLREDLRHGVGRKAFEE